MNIGTFAKLPRSVPPCALTRALLLAPALMMAAPLAQATTATFSGFSDSAPGFFDIGTTAPDGGDPNTLIIGLDAFFAPTGSSILATDTLSFWVDVVDPAYRIVSFDYSESGTGKGGTGTAIATGSIAANGMTKGLGTHIFNAGDASTWDIGTGFDFSGSVVQSVLVTITNTLVAIGDAEIGKDSATLSVSVAPVPLPPAVWLLGSAVLGLATIRRSSKHRA